MIPAEQRACSVADEQHAADFYGCRNAGGAADAFELIEAELQTEGEEQEDDADFGPGVDIRAVCYGRKKVEVWSCDEAGDDITKDQRLVNLFKKNRSDTGDEQNHAQVGDDSW